MHRNVGILQAECSELHIGLERAQKQVPEVVGVDGVELWQGGAIVFIVVHGAVVGKRCTIVVAVAEAALRARLQVFVDDLLLCLRGRSDYMCGEKL